MLEKRKVSIFTLGCRVNQYDTEAMAEKFIRDGYEIVSFDEFADAYVINTCTVTSMGDKKSRQMISRARRKNPEAVIAVVGCYSQVSPEEVSSIEGVDIVLGSRNKGDIVYWVNRVKEAAEKVVQVNDVLKDKKFEDLSIEEYQDKTRAFLKIQDGCNRFCSYCLIPYARGGVCSKDKDKIISEVRELAKNGFKEIILAGIHIASYGVDLEDKVTLTDIIEKIDEIDGIERIRIGSIDPTFFTGDVMDRIAKVKKLCPHFHLSLQSGCDETLKRMNRRYTAEQYKETVEQLRMRIKDVSLTTDVIVGFPGETKEEFEKTFEFLKELKLTKLHVFKYSARKGTAAAKVKDDVTSGDKDERSARLIKLSDENEEAFIKAYIETESAVLYEQKSSFENEKGEIYYEGYTPNYIKVISKWYGEDISGKLLKTKLEKFNKEFALGSILEL